MKKINISKILILLAILFSFTAVSAQETKKLYDPTLDGMKQIKDAVALSRNLSISALMDKSFAMYVSVEGK